MCVPLMFLSPLPCAAEEVGQMSAEVLPGMPENFDTGSLAYGGFQKRRVFTQSSTADPEPDPDSPFIFNSHIRAHEDGVLMPTTTLRPPSGGTGRMLYEHGGFGLMIHANFTNQAAMDEAYPAGDYQIQIETTTGEAYSVNLPLTGDAYPGVPKITGATNAVWENGVLKVLDRNQQVSLQWSNPGSHGTWFRIDDAEIQNSDSSPSTGFIIPAGALEDDSRFRATIQFMNTTSWAYDGRVNSGYMTDLNFLIEVGTPQSEEGDLYLLLKNHSQVQVSNSGPEDIPNLLFDSDRAPYSMSVESPVGGHLAGPDDTSFPLAFHADRDGPGYQYLSDPYETAAALNAECPNGIYEFPGGVVVSLAADLYPDIATIIAVNGSPPVWNAQGQLALNPEIENTVTWSGVVVPDFEIWGYQMVEFYNGHDDAFDGIEEERGAPAELKQPITAITIPADSMTRTFTYHGKIEYARITTFEEVEPDTAAAAGYFSEIRFMAVALSPQSIEFGEISSMTYPAAPFALVAAASSGLPVAFEVVSGPATISGGELTVTGAGTVTVRASQRGNATYASAADVTQSFEVEAGGGSLLDDFRTAHELAVDGSQDAMCPAGDGVPNLMKFAFNMIGTGEGQATSLGVPNRSILGPEGDAGLPRMGMGEGRLTLTYVRFKATAAPGIAYAVEFSDSLGSWATNPSAVETVVEIDANLERVTVMDHSVFGKRFARVRLVAD